MGYLDLQNSQPSESPSFFNLGQSLAPQPMSQPSPQPSRSEQWNSILGQLNNGYAQLDAPGQAQLNDLNLKTESLFAQRNRLRPDEFDLAMQSLNDRATDYPWNHHIKPPGSNPGDVVEEDGIMKLTEADGNRRPIAYTAQYMARNAMPIGQTGKVAIPVAPDKPYEIVDARERDIASERSEIDKAAKGIEKIYGELAKQFAPEKVIKDADGKEIGMMPFTRDERRQLSILARDAYVKDQLQAKNAAKTITDAGAHELSQAIGGDVDDPYFKEQAMIDQSRELLMLRQARKEAAADIMREKGMRPVPTMSPTPETGATPEIATTDETIDMNDPAVKAFLQGTQSPEQKAAASLEYQQAYQAAASVVKGPTFEDRLVQAGMLRDPLQASSKAAMNEQYASAPDGTVVELPTRQRYIKDDGKFWALPTQFDYKHLRSPVMLDEAGEPVIDPNTGKPAPGTVAQLAAGHAADIQMNESGYTVNGGAITPYGQEQNASPVGPPASQPTAEVEGLQTAATPTPGYVQDNLQYQPKPSPGTAPAPVTPEQTTAAARGVESTRFPQPQAHQPAVATQEVEAAKVRQEHDRTTRFDPSKMKTRLKELLSLNPRLQITLTNAIPLVSGQNPDTIPAGTAFRTASGSIYIKRADGNLEGPFTHDMIRAEARKSTQQQLGDRARRMPLPIAY